MSIRTLSVVALLVDQIFGSKISADAAERKDEPGSLMEWAALLKTARDR
jgi:hypothetical protein